MRNKTDNRTKIVLIVLVLTAYVTIRLFLKETNTDSNTEQFALQAIAQILLMKN